MKNRGIIKRLVMGKPRETDLTESDLPRTRFAQFKHCMRTRFGVLFRINMLAALFFVPLAVWDLLVSGYISSLASDLPQAEYVARTLSLTLLRFGSEIPLIMLAFVGLSGLMYVTRRVCWGESIKIIADFGKGIKQSWLQFLLLGLVTGGVWLGIRVAIGQSAVMLASNPTLYTFIIVASVLLAVVCAVALMFAINMSSLYNIGFGRLVFNSLLLAFKRAIVGIGIVIVSLLPVLVFALMPWAIVQIVGYCVDAVFSLGFAALIQTVYCHSVFDDVINQSFYPEYVRIGLASLVDDEEDDGEDEEETDGEELTQDNTDEAENVGEELTEHNTDEAQEQVNNDEAIEQSEEHDSEQSGHAVENEQGGDET